jgi:hypothetical protein
LLKGKGAKQSPPKFESCQAAVTMEPPPAPHPVKKRIRKCDRRACKATGCTCTPYAVKRRQLRDHRAQMRFMQDVIDDNDLTEEADDFWIQDTENSGFWLGMDSDFDESSDEEDPMTTLIQENAENASVQHFLHLAQSMCEVGQIRLDLERARMQLEDRRR